MNDNPVEDGGRPGPNRREFIRRGAMALGVTAWGVPLVQVVRTRHGGSQKVDGGPQEIGVQEVTASCTTCVVECGGVTECGTNGILICFCAPSADVYPIANCVCASEVFCEEGIPCSQGCPPGWACAQGCCDLPICLPPCPEAALAPLAAQETRQAGTRLTVTGRHL